MTQAEYINHSTWRVEKSGSLCCLIAIALSRNLGPETRRNLKFALRTSLNLYIQEAEFLMGKTIQHDLENALERIVSSPNEVEPVLDELFPANSVPKAARMRPLSKPSALADAKAAIKALEHFHK